MLTGRRLGSFEVMEQIGKGGMGEVYRARDLELDRYVAIKLLPDEVADDPQALERLQREARLLAAVSHTNIGAIYGLEHAAGKTFLQLELVEGESLRLRLEAGSVGVEPALRIALQVAQALEAAHARGIIHRDLKPANVQVSESGAVKVLDFGLALAVAVPMAPDDAAEAPTQEFFQLPEGAAQGTVGYMSPEQIRGAEIDKRADIWAFGCLLFELLAGRQAFVGLTVADTLGAALHREPEWSALPGLPSRLTDLLMRCLRKDPHQRLHDIADARIEIEEVLESLQAPASGRSQRRRGDRRRRAALRRRSWIAGAAVFGAIAMLALIYLGPRTPPAGRPAVQRLTLDLPAGHVLAIDDEKPPPVAISEDGSRVAMVAAGEAGTQIFVRRIDQLAAEPVAGTEGGYGPFFSPDGRWLAFFADGQLQKVLLHGGQPTAIAEAPRGWGGAWGADGTILYAPAIGSGLWSIPAAGGEAVRLTTPDLARGERQHDSPRWLPDGESALFNIWTGGSYSDAQVGLLYLDGGSWRSLVVGGSDAFFVAPGYLVWSASGALMAQPFDLRTREFIGRRGQVVESLLSTEGIGAGIFAVSATGTLVYARGPAPSAASRLMWIDRSGSMQAVTEQRRAYNLPRLAPDGSRIIFQSSEDGFDIWLYEIARDTFSRLTFDEAWEGFPIWTPDGRRVTFASGRAGPFGLFWTPADGSGGPEELVVGSDPRWPTSWSRDGKTLIYHQMSPETGFDIWRLDLGGAPEVFLRSEFDESWGRLSPDGRWLAYESDESGESQIQVVSFPERDRKWQVSGREGGVRPFWSPDGEELFYMTFQDSSDLVVVPIARGEDLAPGRPEILFPRQGVLISEMAPDGRRFLGTQDPEPETIERLVTVVNWTTELEQALAADGEVDR